MLDLMLEHFAEESYWTRGRYDDGNGGHCLVLARTFLCAPLPSPARIETAECFVAATRATIRHGRNRAFYAIEANRVQLPPFGSVAAAESYYATLLHELTH